MWKIWIVVLGLLLALLYWYYNESRPQPLATAQSVSGNFVLALSWQSGFCETRPKLPECRSQTAGRYDAQNFTLHGLWPQPRSNIYCGVAAREKAIDMKRNWSQLSKLHLSKNTRQLLNKVMPGTQSYLQRHEWIKHGSCYGQVSAERYFADSIELVRQVNQSSLQQLFADNIGRSLSIEQIRRVFNRDFGKGVGKRMRMTCKNDGRRRVITEIKLNLSGMISSATNLAELLATASPMAPGCGRGVVDAVGLQ